jgi:hypothetical protein
VECRLGIGPLGSKVAFIRQLPYGNKAVSRTSPFDEAVQRVHAQLGFRLASLIVLQTYSTYQFSLAMVMVPEIHKSAL